MKFYEDKPNKKQVEVVAIGNNDDAYYIPKLYGNHLGQNDLTSKIFHNCEDISSSYLCQNAHQCGIYLLM